MFSDTAKRLAQETSMCDTKEDEEEDDELQYTRRVGGRSTGVELDLSVEQICLSNVSLRERR